MFVERRSDAADLAQQLEADGFKALPIGGDLVQSQRDRALVHSARGPSTSSLRRASQPAGSTCRTSGRGADVAADRSETYTHRSGRTGRAGRRAGASCLPRAVAVQERLVATPALTSVGPMFLRRRMSSGSSRSGIARRSPSDRGVAAGQRSRDAASQGAPPGHGAEDLVAVLLDAASRGDRPAPGTWVTAPSRRAAEGGGQRSERAPSAGSVRFFIS